LMSTIALSTLASSMPCGLALARFHHGAAKFRWHL
jgi:hypothetical protein